MTSYDYVQYAYVECPDSADVNGRNLLVKFVGLNIYRSDDDSYAVFIITDDNGQLYMTDTYECWARSKTTAYANGTLSSMGSNGAEDNIYTIGDEELPNAIHRQCIALGVDYSAESLEVSNCSLAASNKL